MKPLLTRLACILVVPLGSTHLMSQPTGPTTRPPSIDNIERQQAEEQKLLLKQARRSGATVAPPVKRSPKSLMAGSHILTHRGHWTIVPKGSILHIPTRYQKMVAKSPQGELVSWTKFLRLNQGWVQTLPMNQQQASGQSPISPQTLKAQRSAGKVIITTLSKRPTAAPKPTSSVTKR